MRKVRDVSVSATTWLDRVVFSTGWFRHLGYRAVNTVLHILDGWILRSFEVEANI